MPQLVRDDNVHTKGQFIFHDCFSEKKLHFDNSKAMKSVSVSRRYIKCKMSKPCKKSIEDD